MSLLEDLKGIFTHHAEKFDTRLERIEDHLAALATKETDDHTVITQSVSVDVGAGSTTAISLPTVPQGVRWEYDIICAVNAAGGNVNFVVFIDSINSVPINASVTQAAAVSVSFPSSSGRITEGRALVVNLTAATAGTVTIGAQAKQTYLEEVPKSTLQGGN